MVIVTPPALMVTLLTFGTAQFLTLKRCPV